MTFLGVVLIGAGVLLYVSGIEGVSLATTFHNIMSGAAWTSGASGGQNDPAGTRPPV